jgi:uncharacterized protein
MAASRPGERAAPLDAAGRVAELDVLRGVALFGVFLINLLGFAGSGLMATQQQLLSLPTAPLDAVAAELADWLVADKANTLFAFLFGLGFSLQMQRLEARGANFDRLYRRRLTVLLLFGVAHLLFLWPWDILNTYALAGFLLLALRDARDSTLLRWGLPLALLSLTAHEVLVASTGLGDGHGLPSPYTDEAVLARQAASVAGDYPALLRLFAEYQLADYLLNGLFVGWLLYALGRFMLGAWVGRRGWLQDAPSFLPGFRRVLRVALPAGLIGEGLASVVRYYGATGRLPDWPHWGLLGDALHMLATPVLAAAYLCAVVVGLQAPRLRRWLSPFAYAGRMALTLYVSQSLCIALVLLGVGPGLALAGRIGSVTVIAIVIVLFALQVVASRWWLQRHRHGPLEWAWRRLSYGRW